MAVSNNGGDYFGSRPAIRARPPSGIAAATASPSSPRTPILGRSISSQFGSPSAFRSEQEEHMIYELGARHVSAGFAGESRPRCIIGFSPESARRLGDYRAYGTGYQRKRRKLAKEEDWGQEYELYRTDIRSVDLGLVEDKLERAIRRIHVDHLQLDQKPRKVVLVVPSLLPTPLVEIALKVLFSYSPQPPSIVILTTPVLACIGAGLRHALVVDIGWEETVVTAIGEYKEVLQRRSVKAGKLLTREMSKLLEDEFKNQRAAEGTTDESEETEVSFEYAEEVTQRMGWVRAHSQTSLGQEQSGMAKLPLPDSESQKHMHIPFTRLSKPAEVALSTSSDTTRDDDHNLPIQILAYRVLRALPQDLRALCLSRVVLTGGVSSLPGLKQLLLQELTDLIANLGWDPVNSYGSATTHHNRILKERSANIARVRQRDFTDDNVQLSPAKKPIQDAVPHMDRIHDDKFDMITQKAEREANKGKADFAKGTVRGVETLGAWAGASLMTSMRVKGVHEVEREDFLKHGLRDSSTIT